MNKIIGGSIPKEFISPIEKGIIEATENGTLAGYPVVDIKGTLTDGSYHDVDSSEMAFKIAGSMGFKAALKGAGQILLEPVMNVEVVVPEQFMGGRHRGFELEKRKIHGMDSRGGFQVVDAKVPLANMFGYSTDMRSLTQGRATFTMQFSHYEQVPNSVLETITAKAQAR